MADEIKKEGGEGGGEGTEGKTPLAPEKKNSSAPEPKHAKASEEKPAKEEPRVHALGDDDELPETDELLQLSKSALAKRLARHSKSSLKATFGTDDVEKIKADLAELDDHRKKAEERRREALTKEQKLQEERDAEKARADKAEKDLQDEKDRVTYAGYDNDVETVLDRHVDPEAHELAMAKLKAHIRELDDDDPELKNLKKLSDKFFGDWIKKNPKFAKPTDDAGTKPVTKPEVKRVPLTTGGQKQPPAKESISLAQKTPKPGSANSMSPSEYREYKKVNGLRF